MAGTMGTIGTTSFFPSKNLGCYGDGGAIFTNNEELAIKLRQIANHGQTRLYYHDLVGCNSRLDAIQAAILRIKLRHLDSYIEARREAASRYDAGFEGSPSIQVPFRSTASNHVFHQYTLTLNGVNRDALHRFLAEKGVPSMIYYPVPCHRQKMFAAMGGGGYHLPVTDRLTEKVISLPMHTELDAEQQAFIIEQVNQFVHQS